MFSQIGHIIYFFRDEQMKNNILERSMFLNCSAKESKSQ
nr:MAG TPA_asm: hypothetical protein [Caudoviricetes sp.]